MNLILNIFFAITLLFITAFIFGRFFVFKQKNRPNLTAGYSILLGVMFLLYFISIIGVVGVSLLHQKYFSIFLLVFIAIPFIIGEKATYEKIRFYSNLQLFMFLVSLFTAYFFNKL
jgi:hypothetical protein